MVVYNELWQIIHVIGNDLGQHMGLAYGNVCAVVVGVASMVYFGMV